MTCSFWLHQLSRYRFKRVGQAGLALLAGFLLAAQLRGAGTRNELWVNAGNWSEKVLSATSAIVPKPADRTTFYYLDLPQTHDGIYVFTWGLREAVQKHYRNLTLDAYQVYPTADPLRVSRQLEAPLDDLGSLDGSPHVFLVYRLDRDGLPLLEQVSLEEFVIAARSAIP
jgi:hypothetical protein